MKYLILIRGTDDYSDSHFGVEAESKEEALKAFTVHKILQEQENKKYFDYQYAFKFSKGDISNTSDLSLLNEYSIEQSEYLWNNPFTCKFHHSHDAQLEDVYQFPDEFWNRVLKGEL